MPEFYTVSPEMHSASHYDWLRLCEVAPPSPTVQGDQNMPLGAVWGGVMPSNDQGVPHPYCPEADFYLSNIPAKFALHCEILNYLKTSEHGISFLKGKRIENIFTYDGSPNNYCPLDEPAFLRVEQLCVVTLIDNETNHDHVLTFTVNHLAPFSLGFLESAENVNTVQPLPSEFVPRTFVRGEAALHSDTLYENALTCHSCGGYMDEPHYSHRTGSVLCGFCHHADAPQRNQISCSDCHGMFNEFSILIREGSPYCSNCIRNYQDICDHCDTQAPQNTMWDTGDELVCCYCESVTWKPRSWRAHRLTYTNVPSNVTFGVEIETHQCHGYQQLERSTLWGCDYEASTAGKEFISPVLQGDQGLQEIECFLTLSPHWEVNEECGTHVHLSVAEWDIEDKARAAYMFKQLEPVFNEALPDRMRNPMCGVCEWNVTDLLESEDIEDFAMTTDKFNWLNLRPLLKLDTIEIRLLHGTLNPETISSWVRLLAKLVKLSCSMTWHEVVNKFGATPRLALRSLCGEQFDAFKSALEKENAHGAEQAAV